MFPNTLRPIYPSHCLPSTHFCYLLCIVCLPIYLYYNPQPWPPSHPIPSPHLTSPPPPPLFSHPLIYFSLSHSIPHPFPHPSPPLSLPLPLPHPLPNPLSPTPSPTLLGVLRVTKLGSEHQVVCSIYVSLYILVCMLTCCQSSNLVLSLSGSSAVLGCVPVSRPVLGVPWVLCQTARRVLCSQTGRNCKSRCCIHCIVESVGV